MTSKEKLREHFVALGVREGMSLLTHSSLKRTGPIEGGPNTIIDVLLELLGAEGTLMMSTVSGGVTPGQPMFHVDHTPSTVGALSNIFRKREGVLRSLHPVHSIAAFGARAQFFTEGHLEANTPWSPDSPYGKLMRNEGTILFLGVNFACNTCLHALEIEARVPGLHTESTTTVHVIDSNEVCQQIENHWHAPKKAFYVDMEHIVERAGALTYGVVGQGISRLVDAKVLREAVLPILQQTPERMIQRLSDSEFVWE